MAIRKTGNATYLADIVPLVERPTTLACYYSSPASLAEHCAKIDRNAAWFRYPWKDGDRSKTGSADMAEACDMAINGWPKGAERVAAMRDKIAANIPTQKRIARYGVAGAIPDVPRYLAGNPQHMRRVDTAKARTRPVITLISNMTCNFDVNARYLENRAAVVTAIVDAIESAGYAVNLLAFACGAYSGVSVQTIVNLKESHDAVDIGRLAYGLGHPAMFRRLSWAVWAEDSFCQEIGEGLGSPQDVPNTDLASRHIYTIAGLIGDVSPFRDADTAATIGLQRLVNSLREQGCPAFRDDAMAA